MKYVVSKIRGVITLNITKINNRMSVLIGIIPNELVTVLAHHVKVNPYRAEGVIAA